MCVQRFYSLFPKRVNAAHLLHPKRPHVRASVRCHDATGDGEIVFIQYPSARRRVDFPSTSTLRWIRVKPYHTSRREKSALQPNFDRYAFWQTTARTPRLWHAASRHRRHDALKCHMHHVCLHAYMHAGEQVGSAEWDPTVICARDFELTQSNSPSNLSKMGEAKQINFGSAHRFFGLSADAVICILQAHTFCTLISIFTISGDCVYTALCHLNCKYECT